MNKYILTFNGYCLETNISSIPSESGVYLVYRCEYKKDENAVYLKELMYIGQAQDLNYRLNNHDKKELFEKECREGEELCFSYAVVAPNDLDCVENALIYMEKPKLNKFLKDKYIHSTSASFHLFGECSLVKHKIFTLGE